MRKMLLFAALAVAFGCNEAVGPRPATVAGLYPLRSVDGNPPPQIIDASDQGTISIVGGLVTLRTDGTYTDSTDIEIVFPDGVERFSDVGSGTWRLSNDSVFFQAGQGEYFMVRNGVELVQDFDGIELV